MHECWIIFSGLIGFMLGLFTSGVIYGLCQLSNSYEDISTDYRVKSKGDKK